MAKQKKPKVEENNAPRNRIDPVPGTGHDVKRGNQKQDQYKHMK